MVSGSRIDGGTQILSAGVRKTIQSIKEIVGNHSDADIYRTLKEANMDPNETAQKLLNQDPFHEVKRKRDKKKEITVYKGSTGIEPRKHTGHVDHVDQGMRFNIYSDRNVRRGGYSRTALNGISREFRVVRDNRVNQNASREIKPPSVQSSISTNEPVIPKVSEKSSSTGSSSNQKPPVGNHSALNGTTDIPRQARGSNSSGSDRKDLLEQRRPSVQNAALRMQAMKPNDSQPHSTASLNNSVVGVYSSSSDPVHVPSLDSRPAANVGAIKREVGVVGVRRRSSENPAKLSSAQTSSFSNSHLGRDRPSSRESFRSFTAISNSDQPSQTPVPESTISSVSANRSFLNNQYSSRSHQQLVGHQKAPQTNKEWKPKSSQKPSIIGPGVIGTHAKSVSPPVDNPKDMETETAKLQDKLSRVNISENQNVIIAAHIRVSEADRCRLTFGSLGTEFEPSWNSEFQTVGGDEESWIEPSASLSSSVLESSSDETSGGKQVDSMDEHFQNSGSTSPASGAESEHQLADRKESSSPQNLDNYADIGLVHDNRPSYTPESEQQHNPPELPSFSAYDTQTGYDLPYFRPPTVNETVRGQGLPSPQEALSSHVVNSIPASTIAMVQQQSPMAHMYPQVHVSHFANLMPYRQFLSPVYVPPMAMPGYSSNPSAYPHPSNGSNYLLMPGGSSHLTASGIKYGIQQFKPVPTGTSTGFGNFTSPTGYAINAPGGVGSATGIEDSSRFKYKDVNLYVPNPQAETSEIWMNPRDHLPGMQSASYYNMQGQAPTYLPSHTGHASFNAAAAASSHMQFPPGLFHPPPQAAAIANPHHLGGSVGVGAAPPGAQLGAYQQPQLGHLNWTGNF